MPLRLVILWLITGRLWADVNVRNCAAEPNVTPIAYGDLVKCDINPLGDSDLFAFSAQVGEKVDIYLIRYTSNADPYIRVIQPNGVAGAYVGDSYYRPSLISLSYVVTQPGVHTIQVVDGSSDETFSYGLVAFLIYPSPSSTPSIGSFGRVISGAINPRGDSDIYSAIGSSGSTWSVSVTRTSPGSTADMYFRVIQPNGTIGAYTGDSYYRPSTVTGTINLTQSGTFLIQVIDGSSDETFNYNLEVQCLSGNCPAQLPAHGRFVPITPCRLIDTRLATGAFAGPMLNGGDSRSFTIGDSTCGVPRNALAYSLNVTVVPQGPLGFLTVWPTGRVRPLVSTLNSDDGRVVADAAIVPAGASGAISFYVTNPTHLIVDINGYFVDPSAAPQSLAFYPVSPCRLVDTRLANGPLGGPILTSQQSRSFELSSGACNVPPTAQAYSVNVTVVPARPLGYLTLWPTGQTQPLVSTLNSIEGQVVANAALVPAGNNGAISVFVTDSTHVVIDVNGYFAAPGGGGLNFVPIIPCRSTDTRNPPGAFGAPFLSAGSTRDFPLTTSSCDIPAMAGAYSLNATVVPYEALGYLTLWPTQQMQPLVSTLNSLRGNVVSNAAIIPAGLNGGISAFATNRTELILDINGYFAP